jgi:uncharacterized MAPEG superfamily protein
MSIAFWCILVAGLMPLVAVGVAKVDRSNASYDNNNPRDWLAKRDGRAKRAHAAHLNSFEAFPLFAAGVLVAAYLNAPQGIVDGLAITFIAARAVYIWCYLNDHANARSLIWFVGLGASLALFFVAAFAG